MDFIFIKSEIAEPPGNVFSGIGRNHFRYTSHMTVGTMCGSMNWIFSPFDYCGIGTDLKIRIRNIMGFIPF
jgi:hypothetical protein